MKEIKCLFGRKWTNWSICPKYPSVRLSNRVLEGLIFPNVVRQRHPRVYLLHIWETILAGNKLTKAIVWCEMFSQVAGASVSSSCHLQHHGGAVNGLHLLLGYLHSTQRNSRRLSRSAWSRKCFVLKINCPLRKLTLDDERVIKNTCLLLAISTLHKRLSKTYVLSIHV